MPQALSLEVTATSMLTTRTLISDLFDSEERDVLSVPYYISPGETLTLPLTDATLLSLRYGELSVLQAQGFITVVEVVATSDTVSYDNGTSGLTSTTVQAAVDELASGGGGGGGASSASDLTFDGTPSGLDAVNAQDAVDEVYSDVFGILVKGLRSLTLPIHTGSYPFDGGDRQRTTETWNNDHAAFWFGNDWSINGNGGARPVDESQNGLWLASAPVPTGYTGGDVQFRVYYSLLNSGGVGDAVKFRLGFTPVVSGHDLKLHSGTTTEYEYAYTTVVDLENIEFDSIQSFDLTLPEADWESLAEYFHFKLERMISDVEDTYFAAGGGSSGHRVYIHRVGLLWNGWGISATPTTV
jgi:hypothetical protein